MSNYPTKIQEIIQKRGIRKLIHFTRLKNLESIYKYGILTRDQIEKEDFREEYDKNFYRLSIGNEVRLKNAYIIRAHSVEKDDKDGTHTIHCTYDVKSKSGSGTKESHRKVKGTIHWVSIKHAILGKVMLYDRLFNVISPDEDQNIDFKQFLNPNSLHIINNVYLEPSLKAAKKSEYYQFQRRGYFKLDKDSTEKNLIFNKTVSLRDTWAKKNK